MKHSLGNCEHYYSAVQMAESEADQAGLTFCHSEVYAIDSEAKMATAVVAIRPYSGDYGYDVVAAIKVKIDTDTAVITRADAKRLVEALQTAIRESEDAGEA